MEIRNKKKNLLFFFFSPLFLSYPPPQPSVPEKAPPHITSVIMVQNRRVGYNIGWYEIIFGTMMTRLHFYIRKTLQQFLSALSMSIYLVWSVTSGD